MATSAPPLNPLAARTSRPGERLIIHVLRLFAGVSVLTTFAIIVVLLVETVPFFRDVSLKAFFGDTVWQPFGNLDSEQFHVGVWPLVNGTLMITLIALTVAVPLGLGAAVYLSEYASPRVRSTLKPTLEVLAGIPTVVLGYFALTLVTPMLQSVLGADRVEFFNAFSPGIVMGIMIVPTIASVSEDAMSAVPRALREAGYGLGASRSEVAVKVVLPAAISGVVAAIILGMSRAIGETMIVAIASGASPTMSLNPFVSMQTMTGYIAQAVGGEAPRDSFTYRSLFAVGSMLFVITLGLNMIASRVVRRYRQAY